MPPGLADLFTPAEFAAGDYATNLYDYILSLEPELYWPLNAEHGVTDQSGNGHDGTGHGSITIGGAASLTDDATDSSTDFDGTNDYISSAYSPFVNDGAASFLFLISRDTTAPGTLFAGDASTVGIPLVRLVGGGDTGVQVDPDLGGGPDPSLITGDSIPVTVTHAVVVVISNAGGTTTFEISVDGVPWGSTSQADDYSGSPGNFLLGAQGLTAALPIDGKIAHAAILDRAATSTEIRGHAQFAGILPRPNPLPLNYRTDDSGDPVFPRYEVEKFGGLQSAGDSGAKYDKRVSGPGEVLRRGYRAGKTITYTGTTKADSLEGLRQAQDDLAAAFDDQSAEGLVVVTPHPLDDNSGDFRYFSACALTAENGDSVEGPPIFSPYWKSPFVVAIRNARRDGYSYFDQDDVGHP